MQLKAQDVLFVLKLVAIRDKPWSFNKLAIELGMSPSEVHAASNRALKAGLAVKRGDRVRPNIQNLTEFLFHGIQYVFVPERGELNRGMPTSYAAPPLNKHFVESKEPPPVWPDPEGKIRGESFSPLYRSAPFAAKNDAMLYELLALVDALRGGVASEYKLAVTELKKRLMMKDLKQNNIKNDKDQLVITKSLAISRATLKKLVQNYGIRRLSLFGSAARGELGPDSDIDLLAEFEQGAAPSLWASQEMQDDFSHLFADRAIDIASPEILRNPYRRKTIEPDLKVLYEAN